MTDRHPAPNPYSSEIVSSQNPTQAIASYTYDNAKTGERVNVVVMVRGGDCGEAVEEVAAHINTETQKLLSRGGHTLHRTDGGRVWRVREPVVDFSQGPLVYTWHDDGERIRCQWMEITMDTSGNRTERKLRSVWVTFDSAFDN